MSETGGSAAEVAREYRSTLSELEQNSKPQINLLTILADENQQHAGVIVRVIEEHIEQVSSSQKLPALYLIDSIVKNCSASSYPKQFSANIVRVFRTVFHTGDEKVRAALYKLRHLWTNVFIQSVLYKIDMAANAIDPAWPIVTPKVGTDARAPDSGGANANRTPPAGGLVHVNPRFIAPSVTTASVSTAVQSSAQQQKNLQAVVVDPRTVKRSSKDAVAQPTTAVPHDVAKSQRGPTIQQEAADKQLKKQEDLSRRLKELEEQKLALASKQEQLRKTTALTSSNKGTSPSTVSSSSVPKPPKRKAIDDEGNKSKRTDGTNERTTAKLPEKKSRTEKAAKKGQEQKKEVAAPGGAAEVIAVKTKKKKKKRTKTDNDSALSNKDLNTSVETGVSTTPNTTLEDRSKLDENSTCSETRGSPQKSEDDKKDVGKVSARGDVDLRCLPPPASIDDASSSSPNRGDDGLQKSPPANRTEEIDGADVLLTKRSRKEKSDQQQNTYKQQNSAGGQRYFRQPNPHEFGNERRGGSVGARDNFARFGHGSRGHHRFSPPTRGQHHRQRPPFLPRGPPMGIGLPFHTAAPTNRLGAHAFVPGAQPAPTAQQPPPPAVPQQSAHHAGLLPTPALMAPAEPVNIVSPAQLPAPYSRPPYPYSEPKGTEMAPLPQATDPIPSNNRIYVDGNAYEVQFVDDTPVIERDGLPHKVRFHGPPRNVVIDGVPYSLAFGERKSVNIDGQPHVIRFGAPSRELYMGCYPFRGAFGGPTIFATINNVRHEIQLGGPPPEVRVDPEPSYELIPQLRSRRPPVVRQEFVPTGPPAQQPQTMAADVTPAAPVASVNVNDLLANLLAKGIISGGQSGVGGAARTEPTQSGLGRNSPARPATPPIPSQYRLSEDEQVEKRPQPPVNLKDFSMRLMKVRYESVVTALYPANKQQCRTCGLRFDTNVDQQRYALHLDWHFKENQLGSAETRPTTAVSRPWYLATEDWIQKAGYDPLLPPNGNLVAGEQETNSAATCGEGGSSGGLNNSQSTSRFNIVASGNNEFCSVCGEKFEQYYDDEEDVWRLRNAVVVEQKTYHPLCHQDASAVGVNTTGAGDTTVTTLFDEEEPFLSSTTVLGDGLNENYVPGLDSGTSEELPATKTEPTTASAAVVTFQSPTTSSVKAERSTEVADEAICDTTTTVTSSGSAVPTTAVVLGGSSAAVSPPPPPLLLSHTDISGAGAAEVKAEPVDDEVEQPLERSPGTPLRDENLLPA